MLVLQEIQTYKSVCLTKANMHLDYKIGHKEQTHESNLQLCMKVN